MRFVIFVLLPSLPAVEFRRNAVLQLKMDSLIQASSFDSLHKNPLFRLDGCLKSQSARHGFSNSLLDDPVQKSPVHSRFKAFLSRFYCIEFPIFFQKAYFTKFYPA